MEEMNMVTMKIRTHQISPNHKLTIPTNTFSACPTWKLYENPFYTSDQQNHLLQNTQKEYFTDQIHRLHLPIPSRKIAASFWDLTFVTSLMESELAVTKARMMELKAKLECERKARKKMESLNKRLVKELSEERKGREALERVCGELAKEISSDKSEINRIKKGIEEERKMLRVAEVIREERVQMKLADAKIMLEEKFSELEIAKKMGFGSSLNDKTNAKVHHDQEKYTSREKHKYSEGVGNVHSTVVMMPKKSCRGSENHHIKRGIKGFVEFPKVVRAIGCRSSKHLISKLEFQKAQLKILLKQKGTVRLNGLIAS